MDRKNILTLCTPLLFLTSNFDIEAKNIDKPNVILFVVDDLGWSDVSCYGSKYYETPNIDKLTENGVRFTNAYASSTLSSPSRSALLTGKNSARLRITHAIPIYGYMRINDGRGTPLKDAEYVMNLPLEEYTIAEALKDNGYATAAIGKWHVCNDEEYYPEYQGFDINVGGNGHGNTQQYFYPYYNKWRMTSNHPYVEWNVLPDGKEGEYITDRLIDEALKFIKKNKNKPFFLYLSHYAVHTPIQAKEEIENKYKNKPIDSVRGHFHPGYAAMIESVDISMGRIQKILRDLGLDDNTIIIFTSDNGGYWKSTSNYPWRGNKGNFYEGGIRVPLIINWPDNTKHSMISDIPVIGMDLYPTILKMVNLPLNPKQHVDGLSLVPILRDNLSIDRDELFWHFPNYTGPKSGHKNPSEPLSVIRYKNFKLIISLVDNTIELYDLQNDPCEEINISKDHPVLVNQMLLKLNEWKKSANVQEPSVNENYDPNYISIKKKSK